MKKLLRAACLTAALLGADCKASLPQSHIDTVKEDYDAIGRVVELIRSMCALRVDDMFFLKAECEDPANPQAQLLDPLGIVSDCSSVPDIIDEIRGRLDKYWSLCFSKGGRLRLFGPKFKTPKCGYQRDQQI